MCSSSSSAASPSPGRSPWRSAPNAASSLHHLDVGGDRLRDPPGFAADFGSTFYYVAHTHPAGAVPAHPHAGLGESTSPGSSASACCRSPRSPPRWGCAGRPSSTANPRVHLCSTRAPCLLGAALASRSHRWTLGLGSHPDRLRRVLNRGSRCAAPRRRSSLEHPSPSDPCCHHLDPAAWATHVSSGFRLLVRALPRVPVRSTSSAGFPLACTRCPGRRRGQNQFHRTPRPGSSVVPGGDEGA